MRADGGVIPQRVFVELRRAGWLVSPVIEGQLRLGATRLHMIGIEPLNLPVEAQQVDLGSGDGLLQFIMPPGRIYVSPETAVAQLSGQQLPPIRIAANIYTSWHRHNRYRDCAGTTRKAPADQPADPLPGPARGRPRVTCGNRA